MHLKLEQVFVVLILLVPVCCLDSLLKQARADLPWLVERRRALHQIPEIKWEEKKTSTYLRGELDKLGIRYRHPVAKHGIVAEIGSGSPRFALRTDMDALPIEEQLEVDYRSRHPGMMHACGHDAHMAMLLGAAKLLKAREAALPGTVVLLFQPAEEGGAGAKVMVDEGAMQGVGGVFGLHVWPTTPVGTIQSRAGDLMAATDKFWITFSGRGGHGGTPQVVVDSVVAASAAVMNLQPLVSRETDPVQGAVVGVTRMNSGQGSPNIHADSTNITGTINAFTTPQLDRLRRRVEEVVNASGAMYGAQVSTQWTKQAYVPVRNDAGMLAVVQEAIQGLGPDVAVYEETDKTFMAEDMGFLQGEHQWLHCNAGLSPDAVKYQDIDRTFVAEDMGFLQEAAPGTFVFLGIGDEKSGTANKLHTPRMQMLESQLPVGASLHASVALKWLQQQQLITSASLQRTEL